MNKNAKFWTRLSRKYASHPIKDQAAYEKTLARTVEHLGPEDAVLELGCGTGTTAMRLAGKVRSYLATDFAGGMIEIAEERLADERRQETAHEGLGFLVADAFDARVAPTGGHAGYDAVLAYNFFHLVDEPEELLARVRSLLKPGGLYISKTVCLKDRAWLFAPLIGFMRLIGKAPYVNLLSIRSLEETIRQAGFEIIETGNYPEPRSRFVVARKL
ncbi:class I SAM-dependent methyltransferase [Roseibium marinum]|uniref:Ubiquinone/menaquinone biosynthesis C-methylase UbiE n=1 Tax=Roseibium marinum TaxID=281252 RepID=A0A2S3UX33_9HYPH|nr:class I SAM-dependent methyltransferase [Roseibium marinum]POF32246.1 ubiquinone/menaquinone biosynthesis C-methylase UbiE [Roseibium marinum]